MLCEGTAWGSTVVFFLVPRRKPVIPFKEVKFSPIQVLHLKIPYVRTRMKYMASDTF
jgi:hypothetical protein